MGLIHRCKQGLFLLLHRDRQWPGYLIDLQYDQDQPPLLPHTFRTYHDDFTVLSLRLVPEYFTYRIDKSKHLRQRVKQNNWGYAIKLNSCVSARDYLFKQFNSTARRTILRYIKRLEHCFEISYELHFGAINREHYEYLMKSLHAMIVTRFDMKGEQHKEMPYWDQIMSQTFDQILKKEASLFVIYHGQKPIEISLNYHLGKMLFSSVSSFDMDYSKFGLGHIEIYKQLEWCIDSGYILYDMGVGGTDYKRRWSNYVYRFEHHILYPKTGMSTRLLSTVEIVRVRSKELLKSLGVNEIPQRINSLLSSEKTIPQNLGTSPIHKFEERSPQHTEQLKSMPKDSVSSRVFQQQLNNFLYSTQEQEKNITIWQIDANSYRIDGKDHYQLLEMVTEQGAKSNN